jgi:DNA-directed RNA polymerase subunit N
MIIPIRCWSCGKPIAHLFEDFSARTAKGESTKKVLDDLGLERYCCRQQLMGHVELIDVSANFKKF